MNPQVNENQQNQNHTFKRRTSLQFPRLHEPGLKHRENIKNNEEYLDFVENFINGGMICANTNPLHQRDADIFPINQNEIQAEATRNKNFVLNSSFMKNSKVDSKGTPKEHEYSSRTVYSKTKQNRCNSYQKMTFRYCLGEENSLRLFKSLMAQWY
ncbi:hypothetical protein TNIN_312771 [Trichonephila inaurata madagascariensis]|uniref:Uncharacterized protein n=1 Tax=Trichonephila inaurata madagascariensis TaxID=2747483 RepID=A0A8X6YR78_9ARAC|nr:hypothetical protein TNIN_312771 [Trichonephila inaurata madagascariensis]